MESLASFVKAWLVASASVLGYAWVDLRMNPQLARETSFTLTPDFARISELSDWGGRLLHHGALGLLVMNALALGGAIALLARGAQSLVRRLTTPEDAPRVSIVPAPVPTSVPPPAP